MMEYWIFILSRKKNAVLHLISQSCCKYLSTDSVYWSLLYVALSTSILWKASKRAAEEGQHLFWKFLLRKSMFYGLGQISFFFFFFKL